MDRKKAELFMEGIELLINARLLDWRVSEETLEEYWKRRAEKMAEIKTNLIDLLATK